MYRIIWMRVNCRNGYFDIYTACFFLYEDRVCTIILPYVIVSSTIRCTDCDWYALKNIHANIYIMTNIYFSNETQNIFRRISFYITISFACFLSNFSIRLHNHFKYSETENSHIFQAISKISVSCLSKTKLS